MNQLINHRINHPNTNTLRFDIQYKCFMQIFPCRVLRCFTFELDRIGRPRGRDLPSQHWRLWGSFPIKCIDHEGMWICDNNPINCVLSLRPMVLRVFRVICDPPAYPRTERLRLGRATGARPRLRGVPPTASPPHSCWEEGQSGFKLVF